MAPTHSGAGKPPGDDASESPKLKELEQAPTRKRNASSSQAKQGGPAKRRKSSPAPVAKDEDHDHDQEAEDPKPLPRLRTPDLEFDFDRSKLKDPRPTPGREARPRYEEMDSYLPAELAARRPPSPTKPKGRLNAMQKERLYAQKSREDPLATFHHLYRCRDKGREGSPTYDCAGFQLDYDKVMGWFGGGAVSKKAMINGMTMAVSRAQSLEEKIAKAFFDDFEEAREKILERSRMSIELAKDTISKDPGIPWHKIGHEEIDLWEKQGFKKNKVEDWLTYSEEDRRRYMKMLAGGKHRK
ncbi:hypothetical protein VP1G_05318 [Cytospora mali]|uniref:Uncharacterized protein n=1 Tax=Cytospora mali TaxID=578113 RepID=A0A194V252_CYTMA|nr:hypothetical protein VP1G_05318 [Valsa mali var. pyri (nom. inval.)]